MEEEKESIELNVCTYNVVCEVEVAQGIMLLYNDLQTHRHLHFQLELILLL